MNVVLSGAIAGLAATAPMTAAMAVMFRRLPAEERYPLPPRHITMEAASEAGAAHELDQDERTGLTWAGHFAYGAAAGALCGPLMERVPGPAAARGIAFGLAVWAGSYIGWLPAAGLFPPVHTQPGRRNALMVAAHVVWGAATGVLAERLARRERTT